MASTPVIKTRIRRCLAACAVIAILAGGSIGCSSGKYPQCPWGGCHFCFPNKVPPGTNDCQQPFVDVPCSGYSPTCWIYWPDECGPCPPGAGPACSPHGPTFERLSSAPVEAIPAGPREPWPTEAPHASPTSSLELLPTPPLPNAMLPEDSNLPPNA